MAQKAHSAIYIFPMGVPYILKAIRFLIKYRSAYAKLKYKKSPDPFFLIYGGLFIDFLLALVSTFILFHPKSCFSHKFKIHVLQV